jgi:hypothetical protein
MTLHLDRNSARLNAETRRLWEDDEVWVANCVGIEAGWTNKIARKDYPEARRRRDRMLAALIQEW